MHTYSNWAKYMQGFFIAAFIFFVMMSLLYATPLRSGVNPLLWLSLGGISALAALFAHSLNERIAIRQMTGFTNKKELRKGNEQSFQAYKKACGDASLADFVSQEMKYLKNDIKRYIFLRNLTLKLEEIKAKEKK